MIDTTMKMLLVADHTSTLNSVREAVSGWRDTEVTHVRTPHRATAILDGEIEEGDEQYRGPYDVVVADNDTHPEGGLSLCREIRLRAQAGEEMPPVVLLLARPQDTFLANWAQAAAHVQKPIDPFDFLEVLTAVLDAAPVPELPGVGSDPTPNVLDLYAESLGGEQRGQGPTRELEAELGGLGETDAGELATTQTGDDE